jgi:hypothetical protein
VSKARVAGIDKNCTKTGEDRVVTLCPRAIRILVRQLKLRERLKIAGLIDHDQRHSSVSWNLMVGKSPLRVSKQHATVRKRCFEPMRLGPKARQNPR